MAVMKASEFVAKLKDVAQNYKTLYVMGCFGAPLTGGNVSRYAVRCFQASKGLIVNGRADRYTIAALGGTWKE